MKTKENAAALAVFTFRTATRRDCGGGGKINEWRRVCASMAMLGRSHVVWRFRGYAGLESSFGVFPSVL